VAEPDNKTDEQPLEVSADTPLIESVSEDVSAEVGEFMEQAAQQNEAAAEADQADVKTGDEQDEPEDDDDADPFSDSSPEPAHRPQG